MLEASRTHTQRTPPLPLSYLSLAHTHLLAIISKKTATMSFDAKTIAAANKEGGKKGQDLIGMADMGGIKFFNVAIDNSQGEWELLEACMQGANREVDDNAEVRSSCPPFLLFLSLFRLHDGVDPSSNGELNVRRVAKALLRHRRCRAALSACAFSYEREPCTIFVGKCISLFVRSYDFDSSLRGDFRRVVKPRVTRHLVGECARFLRSWHRAERSIAPVSTCNRAALREHSHRCARAGRASLYAV